MPSSKTHLSVTEAAKKLGISRAAVHDAIKNGRLKAKKGKIVKKIVRTQILRGWVIDPGALKNYRVSTSHQKRARRNNSA